MGSPIVVALLNVKRIENKSVLLIRTFFLLLFVCKRDFLFIREVESSHMHTIDVAVFVWLLIHLFYVIGMLFGSN